MRTSRLHFDRRKVLKYVGVTAASSMTSLGSVRTATAAEELRWMDYAHLQKTFFTEPFEKETGIKLVPGTVQNDDTTLALLEAGGTENWDVFQMGDLKNHPILMRDKLVQPVDYSIIPNSKHILPYFQAFIEKNMSGSDGKPYAIPGRWGVDTIGYRTDKVDPPTTVKVLWDQKNAGKISMPDYPLYDILYAAQYLGYPDWYRLNDKQLAECKKVLIEQKKLVKGYWLSDADVINLWTNGEIWYAAASTAGVVSTLRSDKFPVARTVPEEGCPGFINAAYISVKAGKPAVQAAHKFFDYLLGPVFGEHVGLQGRYATATTLGQQNLPEDIKEEIFLTRVNRLAELKVNMMIPPTDPDTGNLNYDAWVKLWNEVKAA